MSSSATRPSKFAELLRRQQRDPEQHEPVGPRADAVGQEVTTGAPSAEATSAEPAIATAPNQPPLASSAVDTVASHNSRTPGAVSTGKRHEDAEAAPGRIGVGERGPSARGRPRGKRSNPAFVQVTAYLRGETYRRVKIRLLEAGEAREFSELVEDLLVEWLAGRLKV